ncbi:site-specific integrase, partial [Rhodopseudomonas parapalustris]
SSQSTHATASAAAERLQKAPLPTLDIDAIRKVILEELAAKEASLVPSEGTSTSSPPPHGAKPDRSPGLRSDKRMSDVLSDFLEPPSRKRAHSSRGRSEAKAIVEFAIAFLEDPVLEQVTTEQWSALDEALTDIPHQTNIPRRHAGSLFARYKYARDHGWENLTRLTEKTIKSRYWYGLYKFIDWAASKKYYSGARPKFECVDPENLVSLPRDAFEDEEILRILKLPLFTGCLNRTHVWKSGAFFVQSAIYWGYLICLFTGMRPGEVGQLECAQIRTDGTFFYFDLRPFEARNGRVALQDLRNLKTNAAGRVIPINPLLIELGLLDRMQELSEGGEKRLFPEWEKYVRSDGTVRWSQPISKSWQYLKKNVLKDLRADVSLYSTRHFFADILDSNLIAQRTRDRILGHVGDVRQRYGRKGILDPIVAEEIKNIEPPIMKKAREILVEAKRRADSGELTVLKTYIT